VAELQGINNFLKVKMRRLVDSELEMIIPNKQFVSGYDFEPLFLRMERLMLTRTT